VAGTVQESFGSYDIQREVGRGGMGVVYLATDRRLGRRVALKVIVPELAADPRFRQRFEREARVAATLEHPHVVPVYEAGEQDGSLFIVMRFIDGQDLASHVRDHGPLSAPRLARLIVQVAGALDAAHRSGVVHRDVKPANVLLTGAGDDELAYLTDFGLTREAASDSGITVTGQWVGTVDYAAPEQILGNPTDARSDVYALGCTAFCALTGQPPYQGAPAARLFAHMHDPPPSASEARAGLGAGVDAAIAGAMAKVPDDRFQSAGDFARALAAALTGLAGAEPAGTVATGRALTGVPADEPAAAATRRSPVVDGEHETTLASAAVADLAGTNRTLSERFAVLRPSTPRATIEAATAGAATAVQDVRRRVAALDAGDDRALAADLVRALDAERAFVDQARAAAAAPSSADSDAIQQSGDRMTNAFATVADRVDGLVAIQGVAKLAAWVHSRKDAGQLGRFVRAVDAVLAQARPGRRRISQVAAAIQDGSITPGDARSGIDEVVTNRQAALAAATKLPAATATAGDIKNKLVEAFRRSLDNDRDFQDGIAAYESGDFDRFATKVYEDAFTSNDVATAAKRDFLTAYNALRSSRKLQPVPDDF